MHLLHYILSTTMLREVNKPVLSVPRSSASYKKWRKKLRSASDYQRLVERTLYESPPFSIFFFYFFDRFSAQTFFDVNLKGLFDACCKFIIGISREGGDMES